MTPRAWVVAPFLLVYAFDVSLTLLGQPTTYHDGDFAAAVEANPVVRPLLIRGPVWFLIGTTAWGAAFAAVAFSSGARWVSWCVVAGTVAHAVGGAAWLVRVEPGGWVNGIAYLAAVAVGSRACWGRA